MVRRRGLNRRQIAALREQLAEDNIALLPLHTTLWRRGRLLPPPLFLYFKFGAYVPGVFVAGMLAAAWMKDVQSEMLAAVLTVGVIWILNPPETRQSFSLIQRVAMNSGIILFAIIGWYHWASEATSFVVAFFAWLKVLALVSGALLISGFLYGRAERKSAACHAGWIMSGRRWWSRHFENGTFRFLDPDAHLSSHRHRRHRLLRRRQAPPVAGARYSPLA